MLEKNKRVHPSRRDMLRMSISGATLAAVGATGVAATNSTAIHNVEAFEGDNSVSVEYSVGESATDEDSLRIRVFEDSGGQIIDSPGLAMPGDDRQIETVSVERELGHDETVHIAILPPGGYNLASAEDDALTLRTVETTEGVAGFGPEFVDADPLSGFEYPYLLYAPSGEADREESPILVEPNNTGTSTDNFDEHRERAIELADRGISRGVADTLSVPLLVPVFPRPREEPNDWSHYTHALDDTTMAIEDGPLERIDEQLLSMVDHAADRLSEAGFNAGTDLLLNGFSASGNFVDRFTVLHPERVVSVTAGGLNGMAILPQTERDGQTLPFHVGIADVETLTGSPVDLDALDDVNQFLYMGAEDDNDTIPYDDAWTDDALRATALDVYGDEMVVERFTTCQAAYEDADIAAQFRVYPDTGHSPQPAVKDIVEFHRRSLAGNSVEDLGETIVPTVAFDAPETVAIGEAVEFDATPADGGIEAIGRYLWSFGDGTTATGQTVTHTYDEGNEWTVELEIVLASGAMYDTTQTLSMSEDSDVEAEETDGGEEVSDDDVPGFGIVSALTAIGGAGYATIRRLGSDDS